MSKEQLYDKNGNPVYIENKKKKGGCLKWLLIAIGVIVLLGACGAMLGGNDDSKDEKSTSEQSSNESDDNKEESEDTSNDEEKTEFNVGETFEHDGVKVVVNEVERIAAGEFDIADEGNNYVRINLTIDNESDKEVSYNTLNFEMQTSDGNVMDSLGMPPTDSDNVMSAGKLTEGGTVTSNLYFEVPAEDENLTLRYKPSFFSQDTIKFNL